MEKKENIQKLTKLALCGLCLVLTGCSAASLAQESTFESAFENTGQEEPVDIYTSSATAVLQSIDQEAFTLSLFCVERNEDLMMTYDGATVIQDKYGSPMSAAQLREGDIAQITYNDELARVGSVVLSGDAWSYQGIARYSLNQGGGSVTIGEKNYGIENSVLAFSEGRPIDVTQIIHQDVVTFNGMGKKVMSITVDQGHGYLELLNAEAVLGGWIEVGQTLISQIAPDMLFTIPEGSYSVRLTATGVDETRDVVIERDQVTSLDLGDIELPAPDNGVVIFEVTPGNAQVSVDNETVKTDYPIRLPLGLHLVTAQASGYDSLSEYIDVDGEETLTVKMDLQEQTTVSGNGISQNDQKSEANITIEAPAGADVYQDNLYMGIAPVTYAKTPGDHTITLRKTGYITRSYNITVADDGKDATYSFPDLEPENPSGSDSVSGNTTDKPANNTVSDNNINNYYNNNYYNNNYYDKNHNNNGNNNGGSNTPDPDDTVSGNSVSDNSLSEESISDNSDEN